MLTKRLANTSLRLPAIGQGTGDFFWDSDVDYDTKVDLLRRGVDLGMTLIDTAEGYGSGISEEIVGKAIHGVRHDVVLATKFSPEHHAHGDVLTAAEGSLRRLGTDYIDIYQVHWPNPSIPVAETMSALRVLVESGKVRFVGLCNFSKTELIEAKDCLGEHHIASLQNEYNLFERTIEYTGLLSYCADNRISAIAYSPLDQGRTTVMGQEQLDVLATIAGRHDRTVAQVILRWLVGHLPVVAIVRSTREQHVNENAAATDFELSDADAQWINQAFHHEILQVSTDRIRVSLHGEWGHAVYQTVEEALENKLGFRPSPVELSGSMREGDLLKPVRLVPSADGRYEYDLIGGRIRYWAWVIAHNGARPIPAYVREGIDLQ